MKANELMIGDWVLVDNSQIQVKQVYQYGIISDLGEGDEEIECFKPIPLTPEILEKNGFEKQQGYFGSVFAFDDDDKDTHVIIHPKENNYTRGAYTYIHVEHGCLSLDELPLEYIHELQHALKLCGIEKQIEL